MVWGAWAVNVIIDWSVHREFVFNVSDWFYITYRAAHFAGSPCWPIISIFSGDLCYFNQPRSSHVLSRVFQVSVLFNGEPPGEWELEVRLSLIVFIEIYSTRKRVRLFRLIFYQHKYWAVSRDRQVLLKIEVLGKVLPRKYTWNYN